MKVSISGKQLDLEESLRTQVMNRPEPMISKPVGGSIEPYVTISSEGHDYRTDCSAHVGSEIIVQGCSNADEPSIVFGAVVEKLGNNSAVRSGNSALKNTVDNSG